MCELSVVPATMAFMPDTSQILISALALAGTVLQAHASVVTLRHVDPDGAQTFTAVDGLKTELHPLRHPLRWWRRQREVKALLADSPEDSLRYWRVWRQLVSWVLLVVASFSALVGALLLA